MSEPLKRITLEDMAEARQKLGDWYESLIQEAKAKAESWGLTPDEADALAREAVFSAMEQMTRGLRGVK